MARDPLADIKDYYDVVVIGSGLGGLTGANCLQGRHSVLLLEHHYQFGGLATWFKRAGGIFLTFLHGFPVGMIKSCKALLDQGNRRLYRPTQKYSFYQSPVRPKDDF